MSNYQLTTNETIIIIRELQRVIDNSINGDVVEFGCYDGGTSIYLAKEIIYSDKKLYVYDSFEGLPEKTLADSSPLGIQFKTGELAVSKKQFIKNMQKANVPMPIIKKGWFSELNNSHVPSLICFAFLDGDYYESIRDSFRLIDHKLSKGAIIIVDDYANDSLPGVSKAVNEWLSIHPTVVKKVEQSLAILHIRD